jgi:hypothetical protein
MSRYGVTVARVTAIFCAALAIVCVEALAEGAQPVNKLADFQNWTAFSNGAGDDRACYAASEPNSSPTAGPRAKPFAFVSHRPGQKALNVLTILSGYRFAAGSRVTLEIGPRRFSLFTRLDAAWAGESELDEQIVRAMRVGKTMVVRGRMEDGTETADTYSLSGFALAYRRISEECKVPVKDIGK